MFQHALWGFKHPSTTIESRNQTSSTTVCPIQTSAHLILTKSIRVADVALGVTAPPLELGCIAIEVPGEEQSCQQVVGCGRIGSRGTERCCCFLLRAVRWGKREGK